MKTKEQTRAERKFKVGSQILKNEAFNKIRQIYHPLYKFPYHSSWYDDECGSCSEQREQRIRSIIDGMNFEINQLRLKLLKS